MGMRQIVRRFGVALHCHRNMAHAAVTPTMTMPQAIQALKLEERRALMQWLTQQGPFWEDERRHGPDDYLECQGNVVTDSAVGEAAWCHLHGIERGLVSFVPSNWDFTPVLVERVPANGTREAISVSNYWDGMALEDALQAAPISIGTWPRLEEMVVARYPNLTIASNAFAPLAGHPFVSSAAQRMFFIFEKLSQIKACFDVNGNRTTLGHEIYQDFFTGTKEDGGRGSIFSDSSDTEKDKFKSDLTFPHPEDGTKTLFCTWHGKIQTPQYRVHFSSPISASEPLYVVYVGPKLTK